MQSERKGRLFAAAGLAAGALLLALLAGAPLAAALIAGAGGALAGALVTKRERSPSPRAERPAEDTFPQAADLLALIDEPLLLVRDRKVLMATPAARGLLGEHIQGVDVRLAIRHPAAADHLTSANAAPARIDLAGLGHPERRWEMTTASLADGTRIVRLADRSDAFASERMRTDFVANASHELKTPLATLLGFLETLQDEDAAGDTALRTRFVAIMFDEARRMHRLVDDLISLSRIEAERFSVPSTPVPLLPLVEEVRASCGRIAAEHGNQIVIDNGMDADPVVAGDSSQLLQMIQNLVMNGVKYGREGMPVTVRFVEDGAGMLRMSVIDHGEGIAAEHLPRLTERFYRADAGRSRSMGGTGLGLAIVKHIVGRHRGRLDIVSKPGQGTQVHVSLPSFPDAVSSKSH